jgi:pimeloyl-ACP methyl ester carboxylesterase
MEEARVTTVSLSDATLHVEERGRGEPLLLLHGLMGTGGDWVHLFDLADLASKYRVVMPDARGHGRSTNPTGAFTFRNCANDVLAVMDALGLETVRAIGVSLGAKTLLHVATIAPKRVRSMVLVSATPRFPDATRATFRATAAASHTDEEWAAMRRLHVQGDAAVEALWRLPGRFASDADDMAFTPEALGAIDARTLIVAGDRDPLYPVELAVELLRGIRGSSLWVIPGGGHNPIFGSERGAFAARSLTFVE